MAEGRRTRNPIRGPQSALTDFLASNNISAAQIQQDHERRVREADQQENAEGSADAIDNEGEEEYEENPSESPEQKKKRKRKEAATLSKIKQSKAFARRKSKAQRTGDADSDDDYDAIAKEMMYEKSRPVPGQLENCELCSKRFTVTPYSKTGPSGGLLCGKCSKVVRDSEKKSQPKKRGPRTGRRQNQSNLLDGIAQAGALSLVELCTKKVADNINDVEEFGDLPPQLLHRLSQILSKRRVLTSRTLNLFLRPDLTSINIYDCAKLETDDFQKIFTFMPSLMHVNLRFAGQMKDRVVDYMIDRDLQIKHLQLDAVNLVSDACWRQLFQKFGSRLESLKLSNLDFSLDDATVAEMCKCSPQLRRLKLKHCWKTGDDSLRAISKLTSLEHLSLAFVNETDKDALIDTINLLGPNLRTLSLDGFSTADDRLLEQIHQRCKFLSKLRLTDNAVFTDRGFVSLFQGWSNTALRFADLSSTRDVDNSNAEGPADPIGLASQGFIALMNHSGSTIQTLNISSCRHISHAAFEEVFSAGKTYPELRELDVSFNTVLDDYLAGCVFRCCPGLKKLVAFACFNVREVGVPRGVALIGGLRAQDRLIVDGELQ